MFRDRFVKRIAVSMCLLAICMEGMASSRESAVVAPVTAIWQPQQVQLTFRSPRVYYSCDGLKNKVRAILLAVGAREGLGVDLSCRAGALINNAMVTITLATPMEATPERVASLTSYSTEDRLVARVNNVQLPTANDIERFDAEWRPIALHRDRNVRLEGGDCRLLREISEQVFPRIGVRLEGRQFHCPDTGLTKIKPRAHVMALMRVPTVPVAYSVIRQ